MRTHRACGGTGSDGGPGFTLVEFVVVVVVSAIVGAMSLDVIRSATQTFIYLPNQTRASQAAGEIQEAIIEGSWTGLAVPPGTQPLRGLRFTRRVLEAGPERVRFENTDGVVVTICWDPDTQVIVRSLAANCPVTDEQLPYYSSEPAGSGPLRVSGRDLPGDNPDQGAVVFRYFFPAGGGAEEVLVPDGPPWVTFNGGTRTITDVRRVEVNVVVQTRSGTFEAADGRMELLSSVALRAR